MRPEQLSEIKARCEAAAGSEPEHNVHDYQAPIGCQEALALLAEVEKLRKERDEALQQQVAEFGVNHPGEVGP